MPFENFTLKELHEDREAAMTRMNREKKLIDEIDGHIIRKEAEIKAKEKTNASQAATAA
jgi:hypothetical protein